MHASNRAPAPHPPNHLPLPPPWLLQKCLEEAPGWLAQVAAARSALLENPCGFTMPQPLELLRQRHVKVAWAHRQKYKAALGEEGEEGEEGDDLDSQAQMSQ